MFPWPGWRDLFHGRASLLCLSERSGPWLMGPQDCLVHGSLEPLTVSSSQESSVTSLNEQEPKGVTLNIP